MEEEGATYFMHVVDVQQRGDRDANTRYEEVTLAHIPSRHIGEVSATVKFSFNRMGWRATPWYQIGDLYRVVFASGSITITPDKRIEE